MKKLLAIIAALLAPMAALAQTYPSPTFNSLTLQNPLTAANGGTGSTTSTGTGAVVLSNSPTLTTPNLGTPSAATLTNATGLPIATGVSGLGAGVASGLANSATGSGSPVLATSPSISGPSISGGTINNTPVGATTASTGAFTALSSTAATGLGTPTSIGTSIYPTIVSPVTTTATTTSGSANITVTSATGIATGMGVYGSFSPNQCSGNETGFMGVYVTAISGTTVTMSCPANATNATPVAVQFGQQRYSPTSTLIASDIGAETLKVGSASQGNSASWLNQISTGQDYRLTSAAQIVSPPGGGYGITVASRTSDATGGAVAFPLQALFFADSGNPNGSEVAYFQSNLNPATAGHGPHIQFEQTIESGWAPGPEDPYTINAVNATIAHRIDCGSGGPGGVGPADQSCTTAIDIVPNNQPFLNGIVFANGSIDPSGGLNALAMPLNYATTWFSAANTYSAFVTSNVAGRMLFGTPSGGQYNFQVNGITAANITSTGLNNTAVGQTTAAAGNFTTLGASGLATLSGGIAGNTTGTAASAGTIGEVPSATFSSVNMTASGTVQNLTSINLTAGVYLVWGSATYTVGTGATMNIWLAGVSQTSATLPAAGTYFQSNGSITATGAATANAPMYLLTLSSAKTIYLTGDAIFSGGAVTATGFLAALRIH